MISQSVRICGFLFFLGLIATPSFVFADGWTWGPFSKAAPTRDNSPLYTAKPSTSKSWFSSMKMPKMPWSKTGPRTSSYSRSNTSTWGKMSATSKRWWNKTTEMLDPYPDPKPSTYVSSSDSKKPKSSWLGGMFQKQESTEPRTANEFLRQEPLR